MKATIIAETTFHAGVAHTASGGVWMPDGDNDAANLAEFAGRACYQSWHRPNPATARVRDYIRNILGKKHFSVLEHGSVTFYFTGISRNCGYEMLRHRHFSRSELSQRYVDVNDADIIYPPDTADDESIRDIYNTAMPPLRRAYYEITDALTLQGFSRKRVRQSARAVMPGALETRIVMTGNHRAWRGMIEQRATEGADEETRMLAVELAWQLKTRYPEIYQDMHLRVLPDGRDVVYFGEEIPDETTVGAL